MLINLPAPSVTSNNTEMVIFITNITGTSSGKAIKGNALENRVFWVSWNTQWQGTKQKTDPSSGGLQAGMMLYCNGGDSWASDFGWLSGMSVNTRLTHRTAHQIWFGRQLRDEAKTLSGPDVEKCFHLAPKFASVHERVLHGQATSWVWCHMQLPPLHVFTLTCSTRCTHTHELTSVKTESSSFTSRKDLKLI